MNTEEQLVLGAEIKLPVRVRPAVEADVDAIVTLINQWAEHGLTLGRCRDDVLGALSTFVVAATHTVIACAALEPVSEGLGEIRSVSVSREALGTGAGRVVVEGLVAKAEAAGLEQIVLLTKTPAFFAKVGFEVVEAAVLPAAYREAIAAKGRTTEGRAAMSRVLVAAPVAGEPVVVDAA